MFLIYNILYLETFLNNPQYRFTLEDPDEDDDEENCTVVIALMQKNRRALQATWDSFLSIGFSIYKVVIHFFEAKLIWNVNIEP